MTVLEMLSKMTPEMLAQGLKKISGGLTPEQLAEAEAAIKSASGALPSNAKSSGSAAQLITELQKNPQLLKKLSQNPELISKLQAIIKNK